MNEPRFVLIEDKAEFPNDGETCWYWDTARELDGVQEFMAVQVYCDRDPNDFVFVEDLRLLFTDQAEYPFERAADNIVHHHEPFILLLQSFVAPRHSETAPSGV